MEIRQLKAFEQAAREGSFTRAADKLNLTQPSVSSRIAALEAELGGAVVALPAIMATPLLLQGEGAAFLTKGFVQEHVDAGRLVCLDIGDMPRPYHETLLISLAERPLDQPNTAFVKMIRAQWRHVLVQ